MRVKKWLRGHQPLILLIGVSVIFILGVGLFLLSKGQRSSKPTTFSVLEESLESQSDESSTKGEGRQIYTDIKGAIVKPGMYRIAENARVLDVVNLAGGFTEAADQKQVNFSQIVEDQMVIYVPTSAEDLAEWQSLTPANQETVATKAQESAKINLNTADSLTLQQLNGIGEKKATAIIAYREEKGSFKTIDEIKEVAGIGDKTFENLKNDIEV